MPTLFGVTPLIVSNKTIQQRWSLACQHVADPTVWLFFYIKKKMEKARADLKADYAQRSEKLKQAGKLTAEALK